MSTARTPSDAFHTDDIVLARISCEDEAYLLPIREYLETHGCVVDTSGKFFQTPRYHIVIGDWHYVKDFASEEIPHGTKRLLLLWNLPAAIRSRQQIPASGKIVLLDGRPLTTREVTKIFAFFFTGNEMWLDLRSGTPPVAARQAVKESRTRQERAPEVSHLAEDQQRIETLIKSMYAPEPKRWKLPLLHPLNRAAAIVSFIVILIILPVLYYGISLALTAYLLGSSLTSLQSGKYAAAKTAAQRAVFWHQQTGRGLALFRTVLTPLGAGAFIHSQERVVSFLDKATNGSRSALLLFERAKALGVTTLAGETAPSEIPPAAQLELMRNEVSYLQETLGLAQAELQGLLGDYVFPFSLDMVRTTAEAAQRKFITARTAAGVLSDVLTIYPGLMGFREEKTYLVLLQNSAELRPTGGFIGSVAIVSFAEGNLRNLTIQDIYALDGQLRGHVAPPVPIRDVLGQEHWYLRDSNWNADFRVAAEQAAWFYEKETGSVVDGVIGVNLPMIQNLLEVTGPIDLPDYNDQITSANFFEKAVFYVHTDFFPGSTQKKDFLGSVTSAVLAKLTSPDSTDTIGLLRTIDHALASKNLLLYFRDESAQALADRFQWSGKVPTAQPCASRGAASCASDFLYVVDANFGVNKVNYFVQRDETHAVTFRPTGEVAESLAVTYTNTATQESAGGGVFRNYSRIYLPAGTIISEVTLDGNRVPTKVSTTSAVPYLEPSSDLDAFSGLGVVFDVPPGSSRQITVKYQRYEPMPEEPTLQYDLVHQKQPGLFKATTKTIFRYPSSWTVTGERIRPAVLTVSEGQRQDDFVAKTGQLEYNSSLLQDTYLRLTIRKQEE